MNGKTISMISYINIIGWLIAFYQRHEIRTPLVKFHLEQALGLFIFSFCWSVALHILFSILPFLGSAINFLTFVPLILIFIGIINASKQQLITVPIISDLIAGKINL